MQNWECLISSRHLNIFDIYQRRGQARAQFPEFLLRKDAVSVGIPCPCHTMPMPYITMMNAFAHATRAHTICHHRDGQRTWGVVQSDLVSLMPFQSHLLPLCLGEASSLKQSKKKICWNKAQLADSS